MLLRDLQAVFAAAIFNDDEVALLPQIVSSGIDRKRRVAVYRNDVHHNLREALRAVYPVVERLVGARFFNHAADRYIDTCPSACGDLHCFGGSFPAFLSDFPAAAQLAYLPDTARLEWAVHEVFHAADHPPLALERLSQVPPAAYSVLRFTLHPACRLLSSPFPVHRIWQANQPSSQSDDALDIDGAGASLLVRRSANGIDIAALTAAPFALLRELSAGRPVCAAYESALQEDQGFDLGGCIREHMVGQTIVDIA
jgi:hypothetical protein